jgi:hypothetical protein
MKLNKEELIVGFIYGSCTWSVIGFWAFIPAVICSFLWAIGGSGPKLVRRIGVPVVVGASLYWTSPWLLLTIPLLIVVVSLGYGMPDATDKGSVIGRFFTRFLKPVAANYATRLTIFILFNLVILCGLGILKK